MKNKKSLFSLSHDSRDMKGFTLLETLIVVGLIGLLSVAMFPYVQNALEVRSLENQTKNIMTTIQRTKFLAVKSKIYHRVRFELDTDTNQWVYLIEKEETPGNWVILQEGERRYISTKFNCTIDLPTPDLDVVYSGLGLCLNYDIQHNTVILQSDRLIRFNQPDQREIHVYYGGSTRYVKINSGS
jgi:prepilin-type N-terminal cleavage/methylation domain-containing protein